MSREKRRGPSPVAALALIAVMSLVGALLGAPASSADGSSAEIAKKKCKKKKKKKKCKKAVVVPATPAPTPAPAPPPPVTRATLSWSNPNVDLDLHAWDTAGNHSGYNQATDLTENLIPGAVLGLDQGFDATGPETFSDSQLPSTRNFRFGVCYGTLRLPPQVNVAYTLTYVSSTGVSQTQAGSLAMEDSEYLTPPEPGGFTPVNDWC